MTPKPLSHSTFDIRESDSRIFSARGPFAVFQPNRFYLFALASARFAYDTIELLRDLASSHSFGCCG